MRTDSGRSSHDRIKHEILEALSHPEAQDGLYFRNLCHLHEEDQRDAVSGSQVEILDALKELLHEGHIVMSEGGEEAIFFKKPQ